MIDKDDKLPALAGEVYRKLDLEGLSPSQRKFVLRYCGNPKKAAEDAGYKDPSASAYRLLQNEQVRQNIVIINAALDISMIASSAEVLCYWTSVMRDEGYDSKDRLAASRMLGKYRGLLDERLSVHHSNVNISILGISHTINTNGDRKEIEHDVIDITPKLEDLL